MDYYIMRMRKSEAVFYYCLRIVGEEAIAYSGTTKGCQRNSDIWIRMLVRTLNVKCGQQSKSSAQRMTSHLYSIAHAGALYVFMQVVANLLVCYRKSLMYLLPFSSFAVVY